MANILAAPKGMAMVIQSMVIISNIYLVGQLEVRAVAGPGSEEEWASFEGIYVTPKSYSSYTSSSDEDPREDL